MFTAALSLRRSPSPARLEWGALRFVVLVAVLGSLAQVAESQQCLCVRVSHSQIKGLNGGVSLLSRCFCPPGWTGSRCGSPVCSFSCNNGRCVAPNVCGCNSGWTGQSCNTCMLFLRFNLCLTNSHLPLWILRLQRLLQRPQHLPVRLRMDRASVSFRLSFPSFFRFIL